MTAALASPPRFPAGTRVVGAGADAGWFHWHVPVSAALVRDLIAQREAASVAGTKGDDYPAVELAGQHFRISPTRGTIAGVLLLKGENMAVHLNPRPAIHGMPTLLIEIRSLWWWQRGPDLAVADACAVMRELVSDSAEVSEADLEPKVTHLDLCSDFQGLALALEDLVPANARGLGPNAAGLRCRADWVRPHLHRKRVTGAEYGKKSSPVSAGIYDKTLEIEQASGKTWFEEIWKKSPDYDESERVMRLEFRLRRDWLMSRECVEATCGFQLSTWRQVREHLGAIWRYLVTRWLVWRGPRTAKTRATLDIRWQPFAELTTEHLNDGCPTALLKRVEKVGEMCIAQECGYRASNWAHAELLTGRLLTEEEADKIIKAKVSEYADNSPRGAVSQRKDEKLEKLLALAGPMISDRAPPAMHQHIPSGWAALAAERIVAQLERERRFREGHQAPPAWLEQQLSSERLE